MITSGQEVPVEIPPAAEEAPGPAQDEEPTPPKEEPKDAEPVPDCAQLREDPEQRSGKRKKLRFLKEAERARRRNGDSTGATETDQQMEKYWPTEIHWATEKYWPTETHRATEWTTEMHRATELTTEMHRATEWTTETQRATEWTTEMHRATELTTEMHRATEWRTETHRAMEKKWPTKTHQAMEKKWPKETHRVTEKYWTTETHQAMEKHCRRTESLQAKVPSPSYRPTYHDQKLAVQPEKLNPQPFMEPSLEGDPFEKIPDEILKKILSSLLEKDLVRASRTSKRFCRISNEVGNSDYWKRIYQRVFQYRTPLRHSGHGSFEFPDLNQWQVENPWKESFKQLHRGVHVRRGYAELYNRTGRKLTHFESLEEAMVFLESSKEENLLIFLHPGHHDVGSEGLTIDRNLQIIGAAPGENIANQVIIEGSKDTTIQFIEGAEKAYLGYVTIKFSSCARIHAVEVSDECSPVIENCTIHNVSVGSVSGAVLSIRERACPDVRRCTISDSDWGIVIEDQAGGVYEDCEIARSFCGVFVTSEAKPVFRRCHMHNGSLGVMVMSGEGIFEDCDIHQYRTNGIHVYQNANPTVMRCEIHDNYWGVRVFGGRGHFLENKIHQNNAAGILIEWAQSDPTIRNNDISGQELGVDISYEGGGLIELNNIHRNALAGIQIRTGSDPFIRSNKIHHEQNGIHVKDEGKGLVEDNEIYRNAQAGVLISTKSNSTLRRNRIFDGMAAGVEITNGATATLEQNVINSNRFEGLRLAPDVRPALKENELFNNGS